jgi:hypothetical protein
MAVSFQLCARGVISILRRHLKSLPPKEGRTGSHTASMVAFQSRKRRLAPVISALHVGGEWQWLVRQAGRDVAEGAAPRLVDAQREAETVALALG